MKICGPVSLLSILLWCSWPSCAAQSGNYADREDVRQFAVEFARSHDGFSTDEILAAFADAVYKQNIIDAISRPVEKVLDWNEYQDIFLTRKRISGGKAFMRRYADSLRAAESAYGVPPEIITAIIGVETMYGKNRGSFRVIDALTTLAFDYPPRAKFFKSELREFFLLAREENQPVTQILGSYAGAMGFGQFIPSSYRRYAVDFDNDGTRDIWNDPDDAIGSVANYFHEHGWRPGEKIVVPARVRDPEQVSEMVFDSSLKPSVPAAELYSRGVVTDPPVDESVKVSPMKLEGKHGAEYWLGLNNFYVITRYNHSRLYAMAVYQLSEAIRRGAMTADIKP